MPNNPIGVLDAGTSGDLDAAKAAYRKQAWLNRAKLANESSDAITMLAGHAAHLTNRYGCGVYAGYIPA